MRRPFKVDLDKSSPPGQLRVELSFARLAVEGERKNVGFTLADFAGLGGSGALGGGALDPATTSIRTGPATISEHDAAQVFADVCLSSASLTCLLNMMEWLHHRVLPLTAVRVSWDRIAELKDPLAVQFPPPWPRLGYDLELDDLEESFDIAVEFEAKKPPDLVEKIDEQLGLWYTAVNRGAYGNEALAPADNAMYYTSDAVELAEDGITWFVDVFACDDSALVGLENALERVHRTIAPLRKVTISG